MSHTNSTTNFNLPQFLGGDKADWMGDLNPAFLTIDTQMQANKVAAQAASDTGSTAGTTAGAALAKANANANEIASIKDALGVLNSYMGSTPLTAEWSSVNSNRIYMPDSSYIVSQQGNFLNLF